MGQVKIKQMDTPHCVPWTYMTTCPCRCILLKKPVTQYNSSMQSRNLMKTMYAGYMRKKKKLQKYSINAMPSKSVTTPIRGFPFYRPHSVTRNSTHSFQPILIISFLND